ncbi:MAG: cyanoexosortase B [Cyanobacteria bacterium P01_A01_bin.105]
MAVLGLLVVLYAPLLLHWVDGWLNKSISIQHEYFSHGLLGIPFAAYLVWGDRQHWQALPNRLHVAGAVMFVGALLLYSSGLVDLMNLSLPLLLAALCLLFKGVPGLKRQAYPLVLVLLSTPTQLPYLIEPYILPLQRFIAAVAGFILLQLGVNVQVRDIYLTVNEQLVEVAPHCAGLKMLFTSLFMGLILTYWTGLYLSRLRTRLFFVGIIAVSVIGNILRNTILTFFHGNQMTDAFHWLHDSWGGDLYSAAMLGSLVVLVQLLQRYVPDQIDLRPATDGFATTSAQHPSPDPGRPLDF